ncbi:maleylpyruvate isomerase N-terminal domain-containing protein [Promineifilum sp.]|uniref:maleylpyruvate isomerase N-terminal domain-containing protein n=1 Tax=Promineifilum sp. TaxID=2664178 RepID=UPI0035AF34F6
MTFPFLEENETSRRRLESFVRGLTDEQLTRPTPYGGTVAALLAHLAFWERRVLVLLRRWKEQGVDESPVDPDMINDALTPFLTALDPRVAVELCLNSAAAVDAELATLTPELVAEIEAAPVFFRLNRSLHRDGHLKDLEAILHSLTNG